MDKTLAYYNQNADAFITGTRDVDFRPIQDRFLAAVTAAFPSLPENETRLLDFGCGSGRDTRYFLERGFAVSALDGSEELCARASAYTGIEVRRLLFEDFRDKAAYEGIWACASLLHLPVDKLPAVLAAISDALVPGGIFYASFKYGTGERERNGRHFTDMNEETFAELLRAVPSFEIREQWKSGDARPGREAEEWLNMILRKKPAGT